MNILITSHRLTYPIDAGSKKRIFSLGQYLKNLGHNVHFVYIVQKNTPISEKIRKKMEEQWTTFTLIYTNKYKKETLLYYPLDYLYEDHIGEEVLELTKILNINMVLVNYVFYSKILEVLPNNIFKVLDTHDKFTDRNLMLKNSEVEPKFWWFSFTQEDEAKALNRANLAIAIQDNEKFFFESISDTKILTIQHIEAKIFQAKKPFSKPLKIGFIGGINAINVVSIKEFVEKFITFVENINSNIELHIAGAICNTINLEHKNIKKLNFVEDLTSFYQDIHLAINPLTCGTGLKIKSIEALSFGIPIISTKNGFEGIKSTLEYHNLDSLDEMLNCIDKIYHNSSILELLYIKSKEVFNSYLEDIETNILKMLEYNPNKQKEKVLDSNIIELFKEKQNYKLKYEFISNKYQNTNLTFSKLFNTFEDTLEKLNLENKRFILYGFGKIGKLIYTKYKNSIIKVVDKDFEKLLQKENIEIFSPDILKEYKNDFILISVLGREEAIKKILKEDLKIKENKILEFKIEKISI